LLNILRKTQNRTQRRIRNPGTLLRQAVAVSR
jgi:hypothetical protein